MSKIKIVKGTTQNVCKQLFIPVVFHGQRKDKSSVINVDSVVDTPISLLEEGNNVNKLSSELCHSLLFSNDLDISCIPASKNPYDNFSRNDFSPAALSAVNSFIKHMYSGSSINIVEHLRTQGSIGNTVILGGPLNNLYSRMILGTGYESQLLKRFSSKASSHSGPPISFDIRSHIDGRTHNGSNRWPLIIDGVKTDINGEDAILVTSLPDPYKYNARVINFAGWHSLGTRSVEQVLTNIKLLEKIHRLTHRMDSWQCLIAIKMCAGVPNLEVLTVREIGVDFSYFKETVKSLSPLPIGNVVEINGFIGLIRQWLPNINPKNTNHNLVENINGPAYTAGPEGGRAAVPRLRDEIHVKRELDSLLEKLESVIGLLRPDLIPELLRLKFLMKEDLPKWGASDLPPELAKLTAPLFLKNVYAGLLIEGKVSKSTIRELDSGLMADVEAYISQRNRRKLDLGDASDLELTTTRPVKKRGSRESSFELRYGDKGRALTDALRQVERDYRQARPTTLKR